MDPPSNLETNCRECDEETMHQVLKGKLTKGKGQAKVLDATVKCSECGAIHHMHIRSPRPVKVPLIISKGTESIRRMIELPADELLCVKNEFEVDGNRVQVTAIESNGKRLQRARTSDIDTLWTKDFEDITIKVSLFSGRKTNSEDLIAQPDDEFKVGQTITIKDHIATIESIKVHQRILRRGFAQARDIVRIYARLYRRR